MPKVKLPSAGKKEGGIYINNNKVYVKLINGYSGKEVYVDNFKKCMDMMRKKIFAYADITSKREELGNTYVLIQLSYKNNNDWSVRDVTEYIQRVIKKVGRENIYDYAWCLEVKPIGRNLHYHIALHVDKKIYIPKPDKSGMWRFGSSNIYRGVSSPYYLCKYVGKVEQKRGIEFPKGARKYTVWLNKSCYDDSDVMFVRLASYPIYVKNKAEDLGIKNYTVRRREGGGYIINCKDEFSMLFGIDVIVYSPWYSVFTSRGEDYGKGD